LQIEDPATGVLLKIPNLPLRMLGTPGRIRFPGLPLGSANDVIYRDLLGYSSEDLARLKVRGAI
jgi:crotonobetainyl-CoA:carnitine CoA-transferase CaiB-like acyl-CoA transferase